MEIVDSARKHGVADADIQHAWDNQLRYLVVEYQGEERYLAFGPTRTGAILEMVALPALGPARIIHAMPIRPKFYRYLQ